jgi:transposase
MNFKEYNRGQNLLLPPSYEVFLGESHEAIVLAEFIDDLDLTSLEESYDNDHGGRRAYHPVMLLAVLIYGYMNGTFSSRKIAKSLRQDLAYMYLAGKCTPDFRTLARFRKDKGRYLETILKHVVDKARELGFISFGTVSLDGTKIYANASKGKNETRDALEEEIHGLLQQAEDIDELEEDLYGDNEDEESPELKTKEGRAKKKEELNKRREQAQTHLRMLSERVATESVRARSRVTSGKDTINTTDSDARLMKMKRGDFANGYNVQIMTENGLVLANYIASTSADQQLLKPTVHTFKKMHDTTPKRVLADMGYSSEDNYAYCEQEHIDAYIPPLRTTLDLTQYIYDKVANTYTDICGRVFRFKQRMTKRRSVIYEYIDELSRKKKYLSVAQGWQRYAREQRKKLATDVGKRIYRQRMHDVESTFGNIKYNLGFNKFRLRGQTGVMTEWNLITLAHNLKKIL